MPSLDWNITSIETDLALRKIAGPGGAVDEIDWRGVRVAHLDTGFREHPVFGDIHDPSGWVKLHEGVNYCETGALPVEPPYTEKDGGGSGAAGEFISDMIEKPSDGHGTRIASVLCGNRLAHEPGARTRVGVVPGLPVVPYRVTDTILLLRKSTVKNLAKAIIHAADNDCPVISISLGFPIVTSKELGKAVDHAYERGVIISAAGGQFSDRVCYPGKFRRTICAGGYTPQRKIWTTADYARSMTRCVDTWAPATDIARANVGEDGNPVYLDTGGSGTSYSTVHVSAAAAMWLRWHGEAELRSRYTRPWQRVEAFRHALRESVHKYGGRLNEPAGRVPSNGTGMLKAWGLLNAGLPDSTALRRRPPVSGQVH